MTKKMKEKLFFYARRVNSKAVFEQIMATRVNLETNAIYCLDDYLGTPTELKTIPAKNILKVFETAKRCQEYIDLYNVVEKTKATIKKDDNLK